MPINRSDLADFSYFLVIARHRSFRRAGVELGVSASTLSHVMRDPRSHDVRQSCYPRNLIGSRVFCN
jgi:hypothetical protein